MALRIIKSGAAQTLNIQQLHFSSEGGKTPVLAEIPVWTGLDPVLTAAQAKEPLTAEPMPSVDLAQIEKAAYEKGFFQGEKSSREAAEQKIDASLRRYSESLLELERLRSFLYTQVEHDVVRLAVEVSKKIVHREIQVDKEIIQTLVRVALSRVAEKTAVTIHLNPLDYNCLLAQRTELSQSEGRDISLLADKSVERGGCVIQTECGDIDARIEEKFKEVEQAFFEGVR